MAAVEFGPYPITKPGYPFTVYVSGTNTLASLFTDTGGLTAAPNPSAAGASGAVLFYAAAGSYDLVVEGGRFPVTSSGGTIDSTFALTGDLAGTLASPAIATALRTLITSAEQPANKGVANGYAGLGAGGLVPVAQLGSGTPTGSKFLRDDGAFAVPPGGTANASALGWTDASLTFDGGAAIDAVANGTTTVTSAAAAFPVGIVGKEFNISHYRYLQGTVSGTTVTLTSGTVSASDQGLLVDVSGAGTNDQQALNVTATGGTFTLTLGGQTTSALAWNASAATVQAALEALSTIGVGNVHVFKTNQHFLVTFIGTLAGTTVATMTVATGSLTGGTITITATAPAATASANTTIASVTDATHFELSVAARTAVTNACDIMIVAPPHHTTVASRTNATTVVLTAAVPFSATACQIAWGTDNRATMEAGTTTANLAAKALYMGAGTALICLDEPVASRFATPTLTSDQLFIGAGRRATKLLFVHKTRQVFDQSSSRGFIKATGGMIRVKDMTVRMVGCPGRNINSAGTSINSGWAIQHDGSDSTGNNYIILDNVEVLDFGYGPSFQGSSTAYTKLLFENSYVRVHMHTFCHFRANNSPGDSETHIHNSKLENTYLLTTAVDDTQFNDHLTYIHPEVSRCFRDVTTYIAQGVDQPTYKPNDAHHIRSFGGGSSVPVKRDNITNVTASGGGWFFATNLNSAGDGKFDKRGHVSGCDVTTVRGILGYGPVVVRDSKFKTKVGIFSMSAQNNSGDGEHWLFEGCTFDARSFIDSTGAQNLFNIGHIKSLWEFVSCKWYGPTITAATSVAFLSPGGINHTVSIRGGESVGGNAHQYWLFVPNGTGGAGTRSVVIEVARHRFRGDYALGLVGGTSIAADDEVDVAFNECEFLQTSGRVVPGNLGIKHGNFRGRDNYFTSAALVPQGSSTSKSMNFVPRRRKNPTALTVTTNVLVVGANDDWFDVTGVATVNNIHWAENDVQDSRCRGGDLFLTAVTGTVTIAHNAGGTGNIRCIGAVDKAVAAGDLLHLRSDERNQLWYVVS